MTSHLCQIHRPSRKVAGPKIWKPDADPMDNDVLGLFVLHRKLCELAAAGEISVDRASDIFEAWRSRLILERNQNRKVY
jgi:hypothetical protein